MSFVSVQSLLNNIVTVHSVSSNTLRDAQIWSILPHIALAASGFSCFRMKTPPGTVACVQ